MMKTFKTWCPLFTGFYNSYAELDVDNYLENEGLKYYDVEVDYARYNEDFCKEFVNLIEIELNAVLSDTTVKYESLYSPQFYNFSTDSINIEVELNVIALRRYLSAHKQALAESIREHHTSRDGFTSFHSNDILEWMDETDMFTRFDDEYKLGFLLEFILENESVNSNELTFEAKEELYEWEYITEKEKVLSEELLLSEFRTAVENNEVDLTFGDVVFAVEEAKKKAELFNTHWIDEMDIKVVENLMQGSGFDMESVMVHESSL